MVACDSLLSSSHVDQLALTIQPSADSIKEAQLPNVTLPNTLAVTRPLSTGCLPLNGLTWATCALSPFGLPYQARKILGSFNAPAPREVWLGLANGVVLVVLFTSVRIHTRPSYRNAWLLIFAMLMLFSSCTVSRNRLTHSLVVD